MDRLEDLQLPTLFDSFARLGAYNQSVIKELVWSDRGRNRSHPIWEKPRAGSFPLTYMATIQMPMYISAYELDTAWTAQLKLMFTPTFFCNVNSNDVGFNVRFSRPPFHHHAWGSGSNSGICPGNIVETARRTKISDILLWTVALLNREREVCMDGGAHNIDAYHHWRELNYAPISHLRLYDDNRNSLIAVPPPPKLKFQRNFI